MYSYINIRANSLYADFISAIEIEKILDTCQGLRKVSFLKYENQTESPWFQLVAVQADEKGNYVIDDGNPIKQINLIELTLPNDREGNTKEYYRKIAASLASELAWEAIYDE